MAKLLRFLTWICLAMILWKKVLFGKSVQNIFSEMVPFFFVPKWWCKMLMNPMGSNPYQKITKSANQPGACINSLLKTLGDM